MAASECHGASHRRYDADRLLSVTLSGRTATWRQPVNDQVGHLTSDLDSAMRTRTFYSSPHVGAAKRHSQECAEGVWSPAETCLN
eukprot:156605-Prymnesium_polylepis.1